MSTVIVIVSADIEWEAIKRIFPGVTPQASPYGEWFETAIEVKNKQQSVIFFLGGWGKISAAASTQYVIDHWSPKLLINLGTCGGFDGQIEKGTIVLVERTVVYDLIEQMLDSDETIAHYTTEIDLSWLKEPYPHPVRRTLILSGDRDIVAEDIPNLISTYGAVAGDWESGAIAWISNLNKTRCLILRGVTDLVGNDGGEAYDGNVQVFIDNAEKVLRHLVKHLPAWIDKAT